MKYGLSLPNRGDYGDIHRMVELAVLAEESGWDGFFIWDHYASGVAPHLDPWITMAAIACHTQEMHLGIHITPLSRFRVSTSAKKGDITGVVEPTGPEGVYSAIPPVKLMFPLLFAQYWV